MKTDPKTGDFYIQNPWEINGFDSLNSQYCFKKSDKKNRIFCREIIKFDTGMDI